MGFKRPRGFNGKYSSGSKRPDAQQPSQWSSSQIGSGFEELFLKSARLTGVNCVRIPNGAKRVWFNGSAKLVPQKTPFDFMLSIKERAAYIDTKHTDKGTYKHSDLKPHQVEALFSFERHGHVAGFVVYFKAIDWVVFFWASQALALQEGEGLKPSEGYGLGKLFEFRVKNIFSVPVSPASVVVASPSGMTQP